MAHDIARQLTHLPMEEAAERMATHLEKFWPPQMRRRLAYLVAHEHPDADLLVQAAVACLVLDEVDKREIAQPSGG